MGLGIWDWRFGIGDWGLGSNGCGLTTDGGLVTDGVKNGYLFSPYLQESEIK
ncbi:hypothetical protein [Mastigocoleus sp. MO_188.B34]|uniref:hypothetical protein n=1 Tax=Mastigocoleus sp. MO_188.B34 TaxID=3036635 RepID=UPI00260682BB|nr:hypothetical protein [Mastigocoleus sp. MO_188.B34]MDJ0693065.1 hypothetical protein [Mastigocoleus sp. MO_188.B34]